MYTTAKHHAHHTLTCIVVPLVLPHHQLAERHVGTVVGSVVSEAERFRLAVVAAAPLGVGQRGC